MRKYCKNCGKEIKEGARFCGKCGTPVLLSQSQTTQPPQSQTARPLQSQSASSPRLQPVHRISVAPKLRSLAVAVTRGDGTNVLCIILAILLVVQTVTVALYGWPGFAVSGKGGKNTTFVLQEGQTSVETDRGVIVDFGPYNAMDGEKVSINEMPADIGSVEGGVRTVYDITAGERSKFDGLITITLPYNKGETDPKNEEDSVFAEYFNEKIGAWELVDYTVNTANNTVNITTDHLSSYCTVTVRDADSPYALLSSIGNQLADETALSILKEFEKTGQPGETGYTLLRDIYAQFLPKGIGNEEAELLNDVLNWIADAGDVAAKNLLQADLGLHMADHVSKLPGKGTGYLQTVKLASKLELFTLGLSTISLTESMYRAYKGEESRESVAAQAYKLAYNAAMAVEGGATGAMKLSMLGVVAIDYSLNKFMTAADQTYKDALFNVVIAYNEKVHPRTDAEWYAMILKLYQNHIKNPDRFRQGLDGIMYHFSSRYFDADPEDQQVATNEAGLHLYTTGILNETPQAVEYCREQYMVRLGQRLQPVLQDVFKKIRYDAGKEFRANRNELRRAFNAPLILEISEQVPDGEKSKYAGSVIALTRPGGRIGDGWMAVLDTRGSATIDATILGYIQAGVPTQLRLWLKGDDPSEDKPALTQEFKVAEKVTVISLGQPETDIEFYLFERYRFDPRYLFHDGYEYKIMAVKRDMEANRLTDHLIRGIEAEVEQDIYQEYIYDSSAGTLTMSAGDENTVLKPNANWTTISGYSSSPEYLPTQWGMEDGKTGRTSYSYIRYIAVTPLSPGKWQVDETGETIEYMFFSHGANDNKSKRLESPSGQSFLAEARSFAARMGVEMYDGQGYDWYDGQDNDWYDGQGFD